MGKLKINGKAEKEYSYNVMEITICFKAFEKYSSKAIEKVTTQCEDCLSILNSQGISIKNISINKDDITQEYRDSKLFFSVKREIELRFPFDIRFSNFFMKLIEEKGYDVNVDIKPRMENDNEIRKELLKLAIEDSKNKATLIADMVNQKIVGIDSIEIGEKYVLPIYEDISYAEEVILNGIDELPFSNQLKAPTTIEKESVEVVWIIE